MVRDVRPWRLKGHEGFSIEYFDSLDWECRGIKCGMRRDSGQCCFDVLSSELKPFVRYEALEGREGVRAQFDLVEAVHEGASRCRRWP